MRTFVALALASISMGASAQTMVLSCPDPWGASENCGGCSALKWSAPDANDKVKTSDRSNSSFQYWTRLGDLPSTAPVDVGNGTEGATASCSQVTGTKTAGELLGATPAPPMTSPPTTGTGSLTLNWSTPTTNTDGTALNNLTGYRIEFGPSANLGQTQDVGLVQTYTLTGLAAGTWYAGIRSLTSASQSTLTSLVSATVSAPAPTPTPTPTPIPTPTPTPAWVVAPVSSNSRPVYEAVLNAAGTALVRGNTEGQIASGKPCGAEVFKISTNSYRIITESDATLNSPTYKGRQHVAICTLAQ